MSGDSAKLAILQTGIFRNESKKSEDKVMLAIPGGLLLGLGAGFFFFPISIFGQSSVFAFTGCIVGGLGLGMFVAAILSR